MTSQELKFCFHGVVLKTAKVINIDSIYLQDVLDKLVATIDTLTLELQQAKITSAEQAEKILALSEQLDASHSRANNLKDTLDRARSFENSDLAKEIDPSFLAIQAEKIQSLTEQLTVYQTREKELEAALEKAKSEQAVVNQGTSSEEGIALPLAEKDAKISTLLQQLQKAESKQKELQQALDKAHSSTPSLAAQVTLLAEKMEKIRSLNDQLEASQSREKELADALEKSKNCETGTSIALHSTISEEEEEEPSTPFATNSAIIAEKDAKIHHLLEELEASYAREKDLKDALEKAKSMQIPGKPIIIPRLSLSTLHEDSAPAPEAPKPLAFKTAPSGLSDTSSEGAEHEFIGAVRRRASDINKVESRPLGPQSARRRRTSNSIIRSPILHPSRSGAGLNSARSTHSDPHHEEFAPSCRITMAARASAAVRAKKNVFSARKKMTPRVMQASPSSS